MVAFKSLPLGYTTLMSVGHLYKGINMKNPLKQLAVNLAVSTGGNPLTVTGTICLFYIMFSVLESTIEKLTYSEAFAHFLDPVFVVMFIIYTYYCIDICATWKSQRCKFSNQERESSDD